MPNVAIHLANMPTSLDGLVTENFEQWTVVYNLADRLVEYGAKNEITTNLAKNYKISPDGKEYTFELASDRYFHNGDPVTVDDVIYSLDLSIRNKNSYSNIKDQIACVPGSNDMGCGAIFKISATEFRVKLRESSMTFLDKLNMNENAIRSKKGHLVGHIIYSGAYKLKSHTNGNIQLELNEQHPRAASGTFKSILISQLPPSDAEIQRRLADLDRPAVMISKGFPTLLSKNGAISPISSYQFASGNSYILALRQDLPQLDVYKYILQQALLAPGALDSFPYLKPLTAIYPPGYALATPVLLPKSAPVKPLKTLKIKYLASSLGAELITHLSKSFGIHGLTVDFVQVDAPTYKAQLEGTDFDAMVAFPFIDIQDEVRVARGYFTGYWNYFPSPKQDLLDILESADKTSNPDQRTATMRHFYRKLLTEYPVVPMFFTPNMILLSDKIDRRSFEYYGNTIRFDLFKQKKPS